MTRVIVFTDLDGTLLDEAVHGWEGARAALAKLAERQIPVVPVTSRTRREVERLREQTGLRGPFIVENGSALFAGDDAVAGIAPQGHIRFGCIFAEAEAARATLEQRLGIELTSLSALSVEEVVRLTGLEAFEARAAMEREFGVVLLPPAVPFERAVQAAAGLGVRLIEGDRFWHIIGEDAGKGRAVRWLLDQLEPRPFAIALGNGASDLPVLELADLPIVVPGANGAHPALAARGWRIAHAPGSAGWGAAVLAALDELAGAPRASGLGPRSM